MTRRLLTLLAILAAAAWLAGRRRRREPLDVYLRDWREADDVNVDGLFV